MTRKDDIRILVEKHNRHLQKLKEQQSSFGLHTPPHILIEIEDLEAKLEKLQTELADGEDLEAETLQSPDVGGDTAATNLKKSLELVRRFVLSKNVLVTTAVFVIGSIILAFIFQTGTLWSTPTPIPDNSALQVDNRLQIGQALRSPNGRFSAGLQIDGNFVVYRDSEPIWATNTVDSKAEYIYLQRDGNLVLYTYDGVSIWASQTASARPADNYVLQLQDDGNLVICRDGIPIWETGAKQP